MIIFSEIHPSHTKPWAVQCSLYHHQVNSHYLNGSAETIIRTNRLVGYQSTSRHQYYEIG